MAKSFFVKLDIAALCWEVRGIATSDSKESMEKLGRWTLALVECLRDNDPAKSAFGSTLLNEVESFRERDRTRKKKEKPNKSSTESTESTESRNSALQSRAKQSKEEQNTARLFFDDARKRYPGTTNGLEQEWRNFSKKQGNKTAEIVPLLLPAIENEIRHKAEQKRKGEFCPSWANFQTWINQERWNQKLSTEPPKPEMTEEEKRKEWRRLNVV